MLKIKLTVHCTNTKQMYKKCIKSIKMYKKWIRGKLCTIMHILIKPNIISTS